MILVTGDVVLDHNIYAGQRTEPVSKENTGLIHREELGGAWLTFSILQELNRIAPPSNDEAGSVRQIALGIEEPARDALRALRPFNYGSVWRLMFDAAEKRQCWWSEQSLGYGAGAPCAFPLKPADAMIRNVPQVLVIDDGGLGFRSQDARHCWPPWLSGESRPDGLEWIILKMSRPLAGGDLWLSLMREAWRERLIVIVSANQLRREGLRVAGGLSWETSVDDIIDELHNNRALRELMLSRHLVVTMRNDAALWLDQPAHDQSVHCQLVFDRRLCEGEFEQKHKDWKAYGYQSTLTASVAWSVSSALERKSSGEDTSPPADLDLTVGLAAGLSGSRLLLKHGHGSNPAAPKFPLDALAKHLIAEHGKTEEDARTFAVAEVRCEGICPVGQSAPAGRWTILGQVSPWHSSRHPKLVSWEPARRVALRGPDHLPGVPCATFEKLQTFDRREIDSLRSLRQLMLLYRDHPDQKKPLCLGVFGVPGSGKSFGLKQTAKGVFGSDCPILEFNLSQFRIDDLVGAFHQVRDKVLASPTPVVFWDEFDSNNLDWLKYFLAPMQDGAFQEGQITHSIGKAVFVFAGGVSYSFDQFKTPKPGSEEAFKSKKGPDFVSRLSGYLNIAGPNPRPSTSDSDKDLEYPVRRAMVIRIALELGDSELQIERGLLTALLGIDCYKNGARSLERLVTYIRDRGGMPLRRAFLPPDEILALLVEDVAEFHRLTHQYSAFYAEADSLAPVIHEDWMKRLSEEDRRTNKNAVPWEQLTADIKDSNIAAALRIPFILTLAGLTLEEGAGDSPDFEAVLPASLEMMAAAEHGGWEEQKRIEGWTYAPHRLDPAFHHDLLRPYELLTEEVKNKDRNTIRRYPAYARAAGFRIIRKPPGEHTS